MRRKAMGKGMKFTEDGEIHFAYTRQQRKLDEVARDLGIVCFRPSYHGADRDMNTVMFYTVEDDEFNRQVDREYSGLSQESRNQMYRRPFWTFENSDANGHGSYGYANFGKIDLHSIRDLEILEGNLRLAYAKHRQNLHLAATGGVWALREADEFHNDMNREIIEAIRIRDGKAYVGRINFYEKRREAIVDGRMSVYEECKGQLIYNFGADFVVPVADEELEELIRAWNGSSRLPKKIVDVEAMTGRVEAIGGLNLLWY